MPMTPLATAIRRLRRVILATLAVLCVIILTGGIAEDYRSCARQEPVRQALRQYALTAAAARRASARHELSTDPVQAKIDIAVAHQFEVSVQHLPTADCSGFPAGT